MSEAVTAAAPKPREFEVPVPWGIIAGKKYLVVIWQWNFL